MFFIKQKTAYEMRISDWSSDVCSSDLVGGADAALALNRLDQHRAGFGANRVAQPVHVAEGPEVDAFGDRAGALQVLLVAGCREGGQRAAMQGALAGDHPQPPRLARGAVVGPPTLQPPPHPPVPGTT